MPLNRVSAAEAAVLKAVKDSHPELRSAIAEKKVVDGDVEEKLRKVLEDVVQSFLQGKGYDPR